MKAVFLTGHGGNDIVSIGERPRPVRKPGEVLVRMQAATLNRVDLYMRDSGAGITHTLPQIMGVDGAGIVEEVGDDEIQLRPGQQVVLHPCIACGRCEFCLRGDDILCANAKLLGEHRDGTFAEYVSLPARNVLPRPKYLDAVEAAALGVCHLTAWRMLFTQARVQAGETVLIFGIGGGVSMAALQLAKMAGARVIVTSRERATLDIAATLKADHCIHSGSEDIARTVQEITGGRGVDIVIENVGAAVWSTAMKSLVRGGRLVTCGATTGSQPGADLQRLFIRQLKVFGSTLGNLSEHRALLEACERNGLRPRIDRRYTLDQAHDALTWLEAQKQVGKLALNIA
ncbi:MAG: zinc-binding dehydrogenase [Proteobacteria bacterium]|nr:zinc-binding dehydrogenase [Pseudomonadota bacterium]MBS0495609.1 zinc-binding dehydrogenase [Pseudomonadota bacterium]